MEQSLRDKLKEYIPRYLWETINHPEGYIVTNEEFNSQWNLNVNQGDHHAKTIEEVIELLYATLLNDVEGAVHIFTSISGLSATDVRGALIEVHNKLLADIQALNTHKSSGDHDLRYVKKTELDSTQRIDVTYEVFTIVNSDIGDNQFTYTDMDGELYTGLVTPEGYQQFALQKGAYELNKNHIDAYVNDTLHRSKASGGLLEISPTMVGIAAEGSGAEITIKYYQITGIMGTGIVIGDNPPLFHNYRGKVWIDTGGN